MLERIFWQQPNWNNFWFWLIRNHLVDRVLHQIKVDQPVSLFLLPGCFHIRRFSQTAVMFPRRLPFTLPLHMILSVPSTFPLTHALSNNLFHFPCVLSIYLVWGWSI